MVITNPKSEDSEMKILNIHMKTDMQKDIRRDMVTMDILETDMETIGIAITLGIMTPGSMEDTIITIVTGIDLEMDGT